MAEITGDYPLIRLDGLRDMLAKQERLLEDLLLGQRALLVAMEAAPDTRWTRLLQYWPQAVAMGVRHVLTVLTIGAMIKQGADATTLIDAISKLL